MIEKSRKLNKQRNLIAELREARKRSGQTPQKVLRGMKRSTENLS
jgi:hypothetical protein